MEKSDYAVKDGIAPITNSTVNEFISRVIDRIVRVEVSDGRIYVGMLMCVDQQRTLFVQDALELVDRQAEEYFDHDMFTPHIIKNSAQNKVLRMAGNIVVPGKHVVKVCLDNKFQALFDRHTVKKTDLSQSATDATNS
jgi:small nuclear ribonucleoprotein (snRNP)-like protein